jgi:hypothetical protein
MITKAFAPNERTHDGVILTYVNQDADTWDDDQPGAGHCKVMNNGDVVIIKGDSVLTEDDKEQARIVSRDI